MALTKVTHYGLHRSSDGTAFLMQGRGGTNATGAKAPPPFEVVLPGDRKHCNHQIALAVPVPHDHHWEIFLEMLDDGLVSAMLPLPKDAATCDYLEDHAGELGPLLALLSSMSSPIYPSVRAIAGISQDEILAELNMTNIQPLVLTGITAEHLAMLAQVAAASTGRPRKLICVGAGGLDLPPGMRTIATGLGAASLLGLIALPWGGLGATALRKYMRNEWPPSSDTTTREPGVPKAKSLSPRGPHQTSSRT